MTFNEKAGLKPAFFVSGSQKIPPDQYYHFVYFRIEAANQYLSSDNLESMRLIRQILIATLILIPTFYTIAQTPDELVKTFFAEYKEKGVDESLDNLYATNPWIRENNEAVKNLKTQLNAMNEGLVGKQRGHEPIARKTLGDSLILMSYLMKFDRQPIRFTFQFYKPLDKWMLYSFKFDDSFDNELEESSKIQMLRKNQ